MWVTHISVSVVYMVYGPIPTKSGMEVGLWTIIQQSSMSRSALSPCHRNITPLTRAPQEAQGPSILYT